MTDPFFGPLVEALNDIRVEDAKLNGRITWVSARAEQALTSHDPAPVLRVIRAAVELEKERKALVLGGSSPSTSNFVQAESNHISAVKALLENPAYREWLEGAG